MGVTCYILSIEMNSVSKTLPSYIRRAFVWLTEIVIEALF